MQTGKEIVAALPLCPQMIVEPGLLELGSWQAPILVDDAILLQPELLARHGFPVDPGASPVTQLPKSDETLEGWYHRGKDVMRSLLQRHASTGVGDLLLVAHGGSHDVLTYSLRCPGQNAVPPEIAASRQAEEKARFFTDRLQRGCGPAESSCGVACFRYESEPASLCALDSSMLGLTHMPNKTFSFKDR